MKTAREWFDEYGVSHQNPINKLIHWICVPIIFLSLIGLLAAIPHAMLDNLFPAYLHPYVHWGTVLIVLGSVFYLTMGFSIFLGMIAVSLVVLRCVYLLDQFHFLTLWQVSALLFVLAWVGQFIGHNIEGKKPSFFKDVQFLLVGPAWLLHFIYRKLGIPF